MILKYRKKSDLVEAIRFQKNYAEICEFVGTQPCKKWYTCTSPPFYNLVIHTSKGDVEFTEGDWITKDENSEISTYEPDIFEQTYEKTEG